MKCTKVNNVTNADNIHFAIFNIHGNIVTDQNILRRYSDICSVPDEDFLSIWSA
jgi:hypothetical protein